MPDGSERRRHPRVPIRSLKVSLSDAYSGDPLGTVADLSQGGLLLFASRMIAVSATLQVKLQWQRPETAESGELQLGITAQWNAPAGQPDSCWCGFQIIDISETDQDSLDALIAAESA